MNRAFGSFPYDDPPAPQEPPQHHTPLSPPRSRKLPDHRPSTSSGIIGADMRNSALAQSSPSSQTTKTRTRSADESLCLRRSDSANLTVTKDKSGLMASNILPHVNICPPSPSESGFEVWPKNITVVTCTAGGTESKAHVSVSQKAVASAPLDRGVKEKRAPKKESSSSLKPTAMSSFERNPIPGHPYAGATQAVGSTEAYFAMRRDSVDADGRSLISSFLDAYCRSEAGDEDPELRWPDDASAILSDDTTSLEYASRRASRDRPGSESTVVAVNDTPIKRPNPLSLVITSPPDWEQTSKPTGLLSTPQSAPAVRNARPLPPLPSIQRPIRPLPRPPVPPPYTSPVDPIPTITTSHRSVLSSTTSSPSSSGSTSFTSVSTPPSISSAQLNLDKLADQPNISKRPSLAPILTISACSSELLSPLTPDMPMPPSPMTVKRHQASKLSKMLGEDITPELLGSTGGGVGRQPTAPRHLLPKSASYVTERISRKIDDKINLTSNIRSAPAPTPSFRDAEIQNSRHRSRAIRPQAIYMPDDTSEESQHVGDSGASSVDEEMSLSELSLSDGFHDTHMGIPVNFPTAITEEQEDKVSLSSEGGLKAESVEADSILEDLDDFEEAHIGWALQNVVTYQKASRVKRATRAWFLERNGQQWEEQNYTNVLKVLRQL